MSSIDERIVEMQFRNSQFESGVKTTLSTLERLEQGLNINTAGLGQSIQGIAGNLDTVRSRLSIFGAVGFTAIQSLTNAAIGAGKSMASALIDPIVEGGKKRALNIAQAKFQFEGLGMDIEATMADALYAVKDTAFGLDEAAVAAANFGATGMTAGSEMRDALRGISGVAAMAGASYTDVANIFSKVAGQGRLMGDDLNRLAARGINAAATLAEQMGISEAAVRKMVTEGKISFDDFAASMNEAFGDQATKANQLYTGALANTRAALARIGADFASTKFEAQRRILVALIPVIDAVNKALAPLKERYAEVAKGIADSVTGFLKFNNETGKFANAGLQNFIESLVHFAQAAANVHRAVMSFISPIASAFKDVFLSAAPSFTSIGQAVESFTEKLILNSSTMDKIKRIFEGVFSVIKIGLDIFGAGVSIVASFFAALFGQTTAVGSLSGSILELFAKVGDLIVRFREWLHEGDRLSNFVSTIQGIIRGAIGVFKEFGSRLGDVWQAIRAGDWGAFKDGMSSAMSVFDPFKEKIAGLGAMAMEALGDVASNIGDWFKGFDLGFFDFISDMFDDFSDKLKGISETVDGVEPRINTAGLKEMKIKLPKISIDTSSIKQIATDFWNDLSKTFSETRGTAESMFGGLFNFIGDVFMGVIDFIKSRGTGELLAIINTIFFIILNKRFKEAIDVIKQVPEAFTGLMGAIGAPFQQFAENLKMMAKGNYLLKVAAAIAILAGSLWLLSRIPGGDLLKAGAAMLVMFAALGIMMKLMDSIDIDATNTSLYKIGFALIGLGVAMALFATAAKKFGEMDWESLAKGIGSITVILLALTAFTAWGNMSNLTIKGAIAIGVLAGSLMLVAIAIERFGGMQWSALGEGLSILAISLAALTAALYLIPPDSLGKAIAIVAVVGALWLVAEVLEKLSEVSNKTESLVTLGFALGGIVAALISLSAPNILAGAASLLAAAAAIWVIGDAIARLSEVDPAAQAIALGTFVGALTALVIAAGFATAFAPGMWAIAGVIAAIGIAAIGVGAGLALIAWGMSQLVNSLIIISGKPEELSAALDILSEAARRNADAIFALLGVGYGLIILAVGMAATGAAAILMGAGLAAAGVGLVLFTRYGELGAAAIKSFIEQFGFIDTAKIGGLGLAFTSFGGGLLATGAGALVAAAGMIALASGITMFTLASSLVIVVFPLIANAIDRMHESMGNLATIGGTAIAAGNAVAGAAGQFTEFYNSLSGFGDVIGFTAGQIGDFQTTLSTFSITISSALLAISTSVSLWSTSFSGPFETARTNVETATQGIIDVIQRMATELETAFNSAVTSAQNGADKVVAAVASMRDRVNSTLAGMASSVSASAQTVGNAIGNGMVAGINNSSGRVAMAAASMANRAVAAARANLVVASPSKVFEEIGRFVALGLAQGIDKNSKHPEDSSANMAQIAIKTASKVLGISSPSKEFQKLGEYVNKGFAKGIQGSNDEVVKAFKTLEDKLESMRDKAKKSVEDLQSSLSKVAARNAQDAKNLAAAQANLKEFYSDSNVAQVAKQQAAFDKSSASLKNYTSMLAQARLEYSGSKAALDTLNSSQDKYMKQLEVLVEKKKPILAQLEEEQVKLDEAKKAYDEYNQSVRDSYDDLTSLTGEDSSFATYVQEMRKKINDIRLFEDVLRELAALGLNDTLYREIVQAGLDAMPFAQSLLKEGADGIAAVNHLGHQLNLAAMDIGEQAAKDMYGAGLAAAQGIVDGIKAKEADVNKQIEALARSMVNALKAELGIKSPSKVFTSLGKATAQGFVEGLSGYSKAVDKSAEKLGEDALESFRKSISGLSEIFDGSVDLNPTITPVLDLSNIEKNAQRISGLLGRQTLHTDATYISAANAALGRRTRTRTSDDVVTSAPAVAPAIQYNQYNNSPKALSRAEIYRQTKNQLSVVKGAVSTNVESR